MNTQQIEAETGNINTLFINSLIDLLLTPPILTNSIFEYLLVEETRLQGENRQHISRKADN